MKLEKMHIAGIIVGVFMAIGSIFLSGGPGNLLYFLLVVSLIAGSLPFIISLVMNQGKQREKEESFLAFVRDLVENVKAGTPISKSIVNLRKRDYGALTPHVSKLSNQLSLGFTLTDSLVTFAKETKSPVISRAVGLISEAERAGGKIESILESVAASVNQIETLRKEQKAAISNLVTQGYLIFFVFIIIMLVLEFKILPLVSSLGDAEGLSINVKTMDPAEFSLPLFVMLLVQSFFAGLVIGKVSEGTLKSGIKHSFILLAITLLVTTGAKAFFQ